MNIQENIILAPYTTFRLGGPARYFCNVANEDELLEAVKFAKEKNIPILVIGSGSNLLIADSGFNGLIIRNVIKGMKWSEEKSDGSDGEGDSGNDNKKDADDFVHVTAGAGEDWEKLVEQVVGRGLYGLEGLSSIPGTVGASPVQNIGAYGVDVSETVESVRVLDTSTMEYVNLSNADCHFAYRDSIFKHEKGRYIVTAVTYKVSKKGKVKIEYKDVREYFAKKNIAEPSLQEVRQAVIEIRKNKLPDWTHWGTAGSFFKNPIITAEKFAELKKKYPKLPSFAEPDGRVKVSLAWILDKVCNAKGLTIGNVGTHDKQALCIVVKLGATSGEVMDFAQELMKRVKDKTGIEIEGEVEWAVA